MLPPDYSYAFNKARKHKFDFKLEQFRVDPELLWEEGLMEEELVILNGFSKIWDSVKTYWVKSL